MNEVNSKSDYLNKLFKYKPWLQTSVPKLKTSTLDVIKRDYPISEEEIKEIESFRQDENVNALYEIELAFINN